MGVIAVRFRYLGRWNVSYFKGGNWHWPANVIKAISEFSTPEIISISLGEAKKKNIPIISKISFSGELFLRPPEDYADYKGHLFLVKPGRIIFSKINARRGCILYTTNEHEFAVSGEYPVLKLNSDLALGEYVNLALRVSKAREQLMGSAAGMAKARTYLDDFQRIEIPVPPLDVQRAIIARWQQKQKDAVEAEAQVTQIEVNLQAQFFADLGLNAPARAQKSKAFTARWLDFDRWSVSFNQARLSGVDIEHGTYPAVKLSNILSMVQYGTSEKANEKQNGVVVLRINNIKNGILDLSDLKHVPLERKTKYGLLLQDGDILIIRTSGSRDLVGTCATFHEQGEYVYASYLIRLRVEKDKAHPDYITWFINSPLGRQQINALSRQIMQNNINSEELRSLQIPLPPLDVQRVIVEKAQAGRAEIARQREQATQIRRQAESEVEALILGTKKIN